MTIYHGQIAIPKFKIVKKKAYMKCINAFCVKEIRNAHLYATLCHSMMEIGLKKEVVESEDKGSEKAEEKKVEAPE